jgi:hypothetical protein
MKKILFLLLLLLARVCSAQVTDNFSDGDFTNSPTWSGDAIQWEVLNGVLHSNDTVASDIFFLSTPSATAMNAQWEFWDSLQFNTSSANYIDVYLISDSANLKATTFNGFFVRIGSTQDDICLYRRSGTVSTKIIDGADGILNYSNNVSRIKITRDTANLWTLQRDLTGTGNSYFTEGTVTDTNFQTSSYFGLVVKQSTASFFKKHFFDDFYAGTIIVDTTAPAIAQVILTGQSFLDVKFSENVEQASSETLTNYSLDNGIGNPASATRDGIDHSVVHLVFTAPFVSPTNYILTVDSVQDINSNMMTQDTAGFLYFVPAEFDIIINEFMADPDPQVTLPVYEYVELYNRSNYSINLSNWTFTDASSPQTFGNVTIPPHSYLILCSTSSQSQFVSYGAVYGFSSFPSLNNTGGETLTLKNQNGVVIDNVYYDETYYHDSNKSDGGWSIERVDGNFTCENPNNWKASTNPSGGTPGAINSVNGTTTDNTAPQILHVCILDSTHIHVFFSEAMNANTISDTSNYFLSQSDIMIGNPVLASPSSDLVSVTLTFSTPFSSAIYDITVQAAVTDCPGNSIGNNATAQFAFSVSPIASDIVINEVLFNARGSSSEGEFVELYNRSNKVIDLSELEITREDLTTHTLDPAVQLTTECYLLFPGDYLVLTDNPDAVKGQYFTPNPNGFLAMNLPDLLTDEDIIVLLDASNNVLDKLHYNSSWHFPLLNNDDGVSLERINPNRSTQDSTNWHSAAESVGFATPGYKNSQYSETTGDGGEVSVDPEIFSPDNDGHNDVANIHYQFSEPGYVANVTIYDSRGRHVRNLVKNELLGTSGFFTWDGVNDKREKSSIGIYLVFIEVFKLDGTVKSFKRSCVLATKL